MRSRNQYDLLSNWSTPLFLNISFLTNNNNNKTSPAPINPTTSTHPINQTNRHSLPVYGYALIAVAAVVIGIVVCILVLVCCVRWGRRRSMKFVSFCFNTTSHSHSHTHTHTLTQAHTHTHINRTHSSFPLQL